MKYTNNFFKFPMKIVDELSLIKFGKELEKAEEVPTELNFSTGESLYCMRDPENIISYYQAYPPNVKMEEASSYGYKCTKVDILRGEAMDSVLCAWDLSTFEKALNTHMKKMRLYSISTEKSQ